MVKKYGADGLRPGYYWADAGESDELQRWIMSYVEHKGAVRIQIHPLCVVQWEDHLESMHQRSEGLILDRADPKARSKLVKVMSYGGEHLTSAVGRLVGSGGRMVAIEKWFVSIMPVTRNNRSRRLIEEFRMEQLRTQKESSVALEAVGSKLSLLSSKEKYKGAYLGPNYSIGGDNVGNDYGPFRLGYFWGALALGFVTFKRGVDSTAVRIKTGEWIRLNLPEFNYLEPVGTGNISDILERLGRVGFKITCYSERLLPIASNTYENDQDRICLMYRDTGRWYYLGTRFEWGPRNHSGKPPCDNCGRVHLGSCKIFEASDRESVPEPKFPEHPVGLVFYADFEATTKAGEDHKAAGVYVVAVGTDYTESRETRILGKYEYWGEDCVPRFLNFINEVITDWHCVEEGEEVQQCWCGKTKGKTFSYRSFVDNIVREVHFKCIVNRWRDVAKVYFHNFINYDSHLLIRDVLAHYEQPHLTVMAKSFEKITTLRVQAGHIRYQFGDTMEHLGQSIQSLGFGIKEWMFTPQEYRSGKDMFPYKWFDDIAKLDGPIPMSADEWKSKYYDVPDMEHVSDMVIANKWTKFIQWASFYIKKDVWIMLEAFEAYRKQVWDEFKTDPFWFQGAPSMSWNLACKTAHNQMWIIQDPEIQLEITENIRGGVSQCMKRYAKVGENGCKQIIYLDINSLYSYCMMQNMPTRFIKRIEGDQFPENWKSVYGDWDLPLTAIICADLICDQQHCDIAMPPAPHKYANRLCTTMLPKDKYLCQSPLLRFWTEHGIIVSRIHYAYIFENEPLLASYVAENIEKRKRILADESFDKAVRKEKGNLFKLLNNSLYGKTCENVAKYRDFRILDFEDIEVDERCMNVFNDRSLGYMHVKVDKMICVDDSVFCELEKSKVKMIKPIQIGFGVLERAKFQIFEFWYFLKWAFKDNIDLLYTDTDSLILEWKGDEDFWETCKSPVLETIIGASIDWNGSKEAGLWSDDVEGKVITEFIGLRSKTYAVKFADNKCKLKNKGVVMGNHQVIDRAHQDDIEPRTLGFEDYKQILFNQGTKSVKFQYWKRNNHGIRIVDQIKKALDSSDSKRTVLLDHIHTEPFGYVPPPMYITE